MRMSNLSEDIHAILLRHLMPVYEELTGMQHLLGLLGKFTIVVLPLKNDSINDVVGYISFWPSNDPSEESINGGIYVKLREQNVEYVADISWSDGIVITELLNRVITWTNKDQLTNEIDQLSQAASVEILMHLKKLAPVAVSRYAE
jgi:hypothetical protein